MWFSNRPGSGVGYQKERSSGCTPQHASPSVLREARQLVAARGPARMLLAALIGIACLQLSFGFDDELIDRCCGAGKSWANDSTGDQCGAAKIRYSHQIDGQDREICLNIAEVCCIQAAESSVCRSGQVIAQQRGSCDSIQVYRADVRTWKKQKECCNCCQLGALAASRLVTCSAEEVISNPVCQQSPLCCHAFQNCCVSRLTESGQYPVDEYQPQSTTAAAVARFTFLATTMVQPTTQPQKNRPDGMCQRYPTQLCEHVCHDDLTKPHGFSCSCHRGFKLRSNGRNCEQVASDSCEDSNPCHATAQCYDTSSGPQCRCPSAGYILKDSRRCEDVNECTDGSHTCTSVQNCFNEPGTYRCVSTCPTGSTYDQATGACAVSTVSTSLCPTGFRKNLLNRQCEDINECVESPESCPSAFRCENTAGSFTCVRIIHCGTGYSLDPSGQRCIDEDECALGTHNCGRAFVCSNTPGSFRCSYKQCSGGTRLNLVTGVCEAQGCPIGFEFDSQANRCIDIDECTRSSPCRRNERCINTPGSYTCESPRQTLQCQQGFEANAEGTHCSDINECLRGTHNCRYGQRCINRIGSFGCECEHGYRMNRTTNDCDDVDECARNPQQYCSSVVSTCVNTHGSYRCECKTGFRSTDGRNCEDINECTAVGHCHHECVNTWGSFQCRCQSGYKLAANGRSCEDIDECSTVVPRGSLCYGLCENTPGSFRCTCPPGYQLAENGRECVDIDECATGAARCSGPNQVCINTRGSYKCNRVECPRYFAVASEGSARNSVRCTRQTFVCPQGDAECFTAPLSLSYNYLTLHSRRLKLPAELFTMRGHNAYKRIDFNLDLKKVDVTDAKAQAVTRDHFALRVDSVQHSVAYISLVKQIQGSQDIELDLTMSIYNNDGFLGSATATIFIYATLDPWLIEADYEAFDY